MKCLPSSRPFCVLLLYIFKMLTIDAKLFVRYVRRADNFTTFMRRLSGNLGASTYRNPMDLPDHDQQRSSLFSPTVKPEATNAFVCP